VRDITIYEDVDRFLGLETLRHADNETDRAWQGNQNGL
jgi:hypothetical protein